ncbi:MAG: ATP-binding protein [Candidatus Omnitrophota bacterium]|nr:ATP-binding protein [Candidatus Omnitrophota bacterium]
MKKQDHLNLLFQELKENPYRQLNLAFLLISIIPILAVLYLVCSNTFICTESLTDISRIFILVGVIMLLGYIVGYKVMQNIIDKTLTYAAKAKRADELKSTFAMSLAHDLKSPLSTIKTNVSGLREGYIGELTKEQKEAISICDEVSDRMSCMIVELIATYMMEARGASLAVSYFDLREVVGNQLRELEAAASLKKIAITTDISKKPVNVGADRDKVVRVINNILNNSIKYTPEGGKITVRTHAVEGFARMEFLNNGMPIPEDRIEKIFDKFERLDNSVEGHGLGLAIAKDIVELHKGKIWAESGANRMNCFTVLLPLAASHKAVVGKNKKRLLIIEDDRNFAATLTSFLSGNGYEVINAHDAGSGIDLARSKEASLIILDLDLGVPGADGFFVLDSLRNSPGTADVPVIVSTSNSNEGIKKKVLDMGADDFIQKPYDIGKLLTKVKAFSV